MKLENNGFTLIEVIIVTSITSILMVVIFSIIITNIKIFKIESNRNDLQNVIEISMSAIENKIEYAEYLNILEDIPNQFDEDKKYIYFKNNDVIYYDNEEVSSINKLFSEHNFKISISFEKVDNSNVKCYIRGYNDNSNYELVNIINLYNTSINGESGFCISYK